MAFNNWDEQERFEQLIREFNATKGIHTPSVAELRATPAALPTLRRLQTTEEETLVAEYRSATEAFTRANQQVVALRKSLERNKLERGSAQGNKVRVAELATEHYNLTTKLEQAQTAQTAAYAQCQRIGERGAALGISAHLTAAILPETTNVSEQRVSVRIREYSADAIVGSALPDVPVAGGVDVAALKQRDPAGVFVVMPIAEIGRTSKNGIFYDRDLIDSIAEQINTSRAGAIFGHAQENEFKLPSAIWVGARIVGSILYGKAFLRDAGTREYFRDLKATGGRIGTSIFGQGVYVPRKDGSKLLRDLELESVDFAPIARASLASSGRFDLVNETHADT